MMVGEEQAQGRSLRTHLIVFGLAIVVPVIVLAAILFVRFHVAEGQRLADSVSYVATKIAGDVQRELEGVSATLEALATSPTLARGDIDAFGAQAARLAAATSATVILRQQDGTRLVDTRFRPGEALDPLRFPAADEQAAATGRVVVSGLVRELTGDAPAIVVQVLAPRGARSAYILGLLVPTGRFGDLVAREVVNTDLSAGLAGRDGRLIATSRPLGENVGQQAPALPQSQTGVFRTRNLEGRSVLMATARVPASDWTVRVAVAQASIDREVRRTLMLFAATGVALLALSLGLALVIGGRLTAPVLELARSADGIARGMAAPRPGGLREVNEVARALAGAGVALRDRTMALERTVRELESLYEAAPVGIALCERDGSILRINAWLTGMAGDRGADPVGRPVWEIVPNLPPEPFARVVETGAAVPGLEIQATIPGGRRYLLVHHYPVGTGDSAVRAVGLIVEDITVRKEREAQQHYFMRELTHRTKNLLSVVQAMALQIAKTSPSLDDFTGRFSARLQSLSGSHDLLVQQNWEGVSMADLARSQLGHYADAIGSRITLSGPSVRLSPDAAQNIGMALHELSTNAAKHGALSGEAGRIAIRWSLDDGVFRLEWLEREGPPVTEPARQGFGHTVVTRVVARALDGTVELAFPPEGLVWRLNCPAVSNGVERMALA